MVLYNIPAPLLFAAFLLGSAALVVTVLLVSRRYYQPLDSESIRHVGGVIIAVAGTLYAVLLGFLTVVVWQNYQAAADRAATEAAAASDAWHTAVGMPVQVRAPLRRDISDYVNDMIDREWPLMRQGRFSVEGDRLIMAMTATVGAYVPRNQAETSAQNSTMQGLVALHDERLRRLSSNDTGLNWLEWAVVAIGAALVIGMCLLYSMKDVVAHALMTSFITVIVMSLIFLILELQYPFRGDLAVPPNAWVGLRNHIQFMQQSSPPNMRM